MICGPSTNGCTTLYSSKCVYYDGPSTTNIGYVPNMSLTALLLLIDSVIGGEVSGTFISSTNSVSVSGAGILANPYLLSVIVSPEPDNALSSTPDGLYVATPVPPDPVNIYTNDGTTVDSTRVVTISNTLQFTTPVQGTFEVVQNNADPNYATLLRIRNGGGASGFIASVNSDTQYLKLGQYGSELKGAFGSLNFTTSTVTLSHQNQIQVLSSNVPTNTIFSDGRMSGTDALNPDEFVTLSQVSGSLSTTTYVSASIASTTVTEAYMNANYASANTNDKVLFTSLSDAPTQILIITKNNDSTWRASLETKLT